MIIEDFELFLNGYEKYEINNNLIYDNVYTISFKKNELVKNINNKFIISNKFFFNKKTKNSYISKILIRYGFNIKNLNNNISIFDLFYVIINFYEKNFDDINTLSKYDIYKISTFILKTNNKIIKNKYILNPKLTYNLSNIEKLKLISNFKKNETINYIIDNYNYDLSINENSKILKKSSSYVYKIISNTDSFKRKNKEISKNKYLTFISIYKPSLSIRELSKKSGLSVNTVQKYIKLVNVF